MLPRAAYLFHLARKRKKWQRQLHCFRYRQGKARRWSLALVPAGGDGRKALEAKLGPLAAFELVFPAPPPGMHAPPPRREAPPWHV